jgi:flagellar FliL protein
MVVKAMAEEDNEASNDKAGNTTMKIVIIAVVLSIVLSGGIAGGLVFLLGGDDTSQEATDGDEDGESAAAASPEPPIYHSMDPKFVVSFRDQKKARFMQFSLEVMARDREVIENIKEHNPAIRSNLLMLVDNQSSEEMNTREGKEQLLVDITMDINQTLDTVGGKSGVEAAYYHSFVIQ